MKRVWITEALAVGEQIRPEDVETLAAAGFAAIVNNRPDGEAPCQPEAGAIATAARRAGLASIHLPVVGADIGEDTVRAFQRALAASRGPVLAFCRSGTRSLTLWAIGEVLDGRMAKCDLVPFGAERGFDLSAAVGWLTTRGVPDTGPQTRIRKGTAMAQQPEVTGFFDPRTWSVQYVVADPQTRKCAIVDPVFDFDEKSGQTASKNADRILAFIREKGYEVEWILDTHPHADHFSAAAYLKERTGAPTAIGAKVTEVQKLWKGFYNWPDFPADGSQWDRLFADGDTFKVGNIDARVMFSPGHTLASITYVIGDAAFVHDTLFMPDSGTARADFPGGSARVLWKSIQDILALPDETRIFTGHDYQPGGREPRWESTVAEQKAKNIHISEFKTEEAFVAAREARDRTLPMPKLILQSLQINTNGGRLPEPEGNGRRYLKIPLDLLKGAAWE